MVTIHHRSITHQFETIEQAMAWAKECGEFVIIQFDGIEVVGKFGADGIENGKLSNGDMYTWKKRRRT